MKFNNYKRKDLIEIILKRKNNDYKFLLNECFEMLFSIIEDQQNKKNYEYDEAFADFNDCLNKAEWTQDITKEEA
jgi:hypothetical protein